MNPRGIDWVVVLGGSVLGALVLTMCVLVADGAPPLAYVRLALVPLATAAAFVLDEPAAAAVDAVPRSRPQRVAARTVVVLVPLVVWMGAVLALELRSPLTPAVGLLVEGAGVLAVATSGAAVLRRIGQEEPGQAVATGVAVAVLAAIVFAPRVRDIPVFPVGDRWTHSSVVWAALTVVAVAVAVIAAREPFRPRWPAESSAGDRGAIAK